SARAAIAKNVTARVEAARTLLEAEYDAVIAVASGGAPPVRETPVSAIPAVADAADTRPPQSVTPSLALSSLRGRPDDADEELDVIKRSSGSRLPKRHGQCKYRCPLAVYRPARQLRRRVGGDGNTPPALDRIPASAYDVVCSPIIDWGFRFQRPQQLMLR